MEQPLDTRQLRAFVELARSCSFTAAAKALFLSQSAVSHSLKALEAELNCILFDRQGKTVRLSPAGEVLLPRAERCLREMELARGDIQALGRWGHGRLRLGATASLCQYFMPAVLREFRDCFPDCAVSIEAANSSEMAEQVMEGKLDLAFGMIPRRCDGLEIRPLFTDQLVFLVSSRHPLTQRSDLRRADLARERLIVYSRQSSTYPVLEAAFRAEGLEVGQVLELGTMEAIKEMARIGMGIGVVAPWVAEAEVESGMLQVLHVAGPPMERAWGAFRRKGSVPGLMEATLLGIAGMVAGELKRAEN